MIAKISLRVRTVACCVMLGMLIVLGGCASDDQSGATSDDTANEQVVEETEDDAEDEAQDETSGSEGAGQQTTSDEEDIEADEDVMASMTCEPLDVARPEELTFMFGYFDKAVCVEVGENDGTMWWVVMFEWDDEDGVVDLREAYLTDSLEMSSYRDGTWIELLSTDPWHYVDWDHDMLVRGQSALELARQTLAG